jgi:hypothetical protein
MMWHGAAVLQITAAVKRQRVEHLVLPHAMMVDHVSKRDIHPPAMKELPFVNDHLIDHSILQLVLPVTSYL